MLNLWIIGAVAVAAKKYGEHTAEKRILAEAEKEEAKALPAYAKPPEEDQCPTPPLFTADQRQFLVNPIATGQSVFKPEMSARLEKRFANCSLEPAELTDVDYRTGVKTYKVVPLTATSKPALDEIMAMVNSGGVAHCSLTCIFPQGERIVALSPGEMVINLRLNPHFAKLPFPPDVPSEVVEHVQAVTEVKSPKNALRKTVSVISHPPGAPVRREDSPLPSDAPALSPSSNGIPKIGEILAAQEEERAAEEARTEKVKAR